MMNELKRNLVAALTRGEYGMLCKNHAETVLTVPMNLEDVSKGDLITSDRILKKVRMDLWKYLKANAKKLSDDHRILIWVEEGKNENGVKVLRSILESGMVSYYFTINVSTKQEMSEEKRSRLLSRVHTMLEVCATMIVSDALKAIKREEEHDLIYDVLMGK